MTHSPVDVGVSKALDAQVTIALANSRRDTLYHPYAIVAFDLSGEKLHVGLALYNYSREVFVYPACAEHHFGELTPGKLFFIHKIVPHPLPRKAAKTHHCLRTFHSHPVFRWEDPAVSSQEDFKTNLEKSVPRELNPLLVTIWLPEVVNKINSVMKGYYRTIQGVSNSSVEPVREFFKNESGLLS